MPADRKDDDTEELYKLRQIKIKDLTALLSSPAALSALVLSPLVVAILGAASRGDLLLYVILAWVEWEKFGFTSSNSQSAINKTEGVPPLSSEAANTERVIRSDVGALLHQYNLENLHYVVGGAILLSYVIFFGLGGFLQWYYYIQRKDVSETWKCQPSRFLTKDLQRHEILLGAFNLLLGATLSGILATLVLNGSNFTTLYFDIADYGWTYFIVSTVVTFVFQDASAYYIHRTLHRPYFYKKFHKIHHSYYSPTAFGAVAMHPVEFVVLQFGLVIPMFTIPVHFFGFLACVMYSYYYGMVDHSGIDFDAIWPWQPPVRFHDDHHKYFHVNFGFNTLIFDRFHDTLRKRSRSYSEKIFGGKGAQGTQRTEATKKD